MDDSTIIELFSVSSQKSDVEKAHRRLTTYLKRTNTVKKEESTSDSNETDKHEQIFSNQPYSQRYLFRS